MTEATVGLTLTCAPVPVVFKTMAAYTAAVCEPGYERNIHTDEETARTYGLDQPIAEGRMWTTLLSCLLGTAFGPEWLSTGGFSFTFLQMVKVGDQITPRAVVTAVEAAAGGRRVELELTCTNQRGEAVCNGSASCLLKA